MSLNDNLILEFMNLGCCSRKDATIALQVYLELCEVQKYWNIEYKYDKKLNLLYLTGRKGQLDDTSIFIPKSANDDHSFSQLQGLFELCQGCEIKSIFLAMVSPDSTCVIYELKEGLHLPSETSNQRMKKDRNAKLDADITKHRNLIEHAALCGTAVTIKDHK